MLIAAHHFLELKSILHIKLTNFYGRWSACVFVFLFPPAIKREANRILACRSLARLEVPHGAASLNWMTVEMFFDFCTSAHFRACTCELTFFTFFKYLSYIQFGTVWAFCQPLFVSHLYFLNLPLHCLHSSKYSNFCPNNQIDAMSRDTIFSQSSTSLLDCHICLEHEQFE